MAHLFKGKDVLDIAVQLEKMGHDFYKSAQELIDDEKVIELLDVLAQDELKHMEDLEEISQTASFSIDEHHVDEELQAYTTELINSRFFTCAGCLEDMIKEAKSTKDVLDLAMRLEKDSILFYTELRGYVNASEKDVIDIIIKKEKQHIVDISNLKREYA